MCETTKLQWLLSDSSSMACLTPNCGHRDLRRSSCAMVFSSSSAVPPYYINLTSGLTIIVTVGIHREV